MHALLVLLLAAACADAPSVPDGWVAQRQPICAQALEGQWRSGCRCSWGEEWGWVWVTASGKHGAGDWCPQQ